jgi:hypothetical protein
MAGVLLYPFLWPHVPRTAVDTRGYQEVAQKWAAGTQDEVSFRAPGYPALLVLTQSSTELRPPLFIVQLAGYLGMAALLVLALAQCGAHRLLVWSAALLLVSPPFVEHAAYGLSESLTACLLIAGVLLYAAERPTLSRAAAAGVVFGLAALTRPTYQLLMLAFLPAVMFPRYRRRTIAALCGAALVVGTCSAVNGAKFGYFGITPALGLNLSTRTVRVLERLPEGELRDVLIEARNRHLVEGASHTGVMYIWSLEPELERITGLRGHALASYMLGVNLKLIAGAPLEYLSEVGRALSTYWLPAFTDLSFDSRLTQLFWTVICLGVVLAFGATLVVVAGAVLSHGLIADGSRRLLGLYLPAVAVILYTMAVSCLFEMGNPRYRVPTDALIVFATVIGLTIWHREIAAARPRDGVAQ